MKYNNCGEDFGPYTLVGITTSGEYQTSGLREAVSMPEGVVIFSSVLLNPAKKNECD